MSKVSVPKKIFWRALRCLKIFRYRGQPFDIARVEVEDQRKRAYNDLMSEFMRRMMLD